MKWNNVKDKSLPKHEAFLVYFRDEIGLCQFCTEDEKFYFISEPAYAFATIKFNDRITKRITHWAHLPKKPEESNVV